MDIGMKTPNGDFTLRVAALIIQNGQLLVVKHKAYDCFYTIGGRIKANETSADAAVREAYEETGCCFEVDRLVFVQERFFGDRDIRHHEVVFFYLMKSDGFHIEDGTCTDQREEMLKWLPIEQLSVYNLVPDFLRTAFEDLPDGVRHIISSET